MEECPPGYHAPTNATDSIPPVSGHRLKKRYFCSALVRTHFYLFSLDLAQYWVSDVVANPVALVPEVNYPFSQ